MEAKLKDKQAVEATVEVTFPAAEVDEAFGRVLRQLSRQVRVPGFRPGKAPKGVLIKRIGQESLESEVREELIERSYRDAVTKFELMPVHAHVHGGSPHEGEDFTFDLHVDLYPQVELPPLDEIVIDSEARQVDEEMVSATIARLQSDNATMIPVDRPVQAGDYLMVETVSDDDGEEGSSMPIDLESVGDELARQLIGRTAGEIVTLELDTPPPAEATSGGEDQQEGEAATAEDEQGQEAAQAPTLRVRIKDVKDKEKPAPDDEFAKTLGFETWEETDRRIRESLQSQVDQEAFEEQREEFVEKLMAHSDFELPGSLVQRQQQNLLENLVEDLRRRGITLEQYLQRLDEKDGREGFEQELKEAAQKGVRRDLLLERLLEQRGTRLSDAEFEAALRQLAMEQGTDVARLRKDRGDDWLRNYRFLLTRDRALREVVSERLAAQRGEESPSVESEASTNAATADDESATKERAAQADPDAEGDGGQPEEAPSSARAAPSTEAEAAEGDEANS